jgi:hypothetical protein
MTLIGETLDSMLRFSEYPEEIREKCMAAFSSCFVPLLGPTPAEFKTMFRYRPCSTMVDDHTPVELSSVVASTGKTAIRFYLEPMSPTTGLPTLQPTWMGSVWDLGAALDAKHRDFSWFRICMQTLTVNLATVPHYKPQSAPLGMTQFYYGT